MWAAWTVLFVCGVGLVWGATLKDKDLVNTTGVQLPTAPTRTRRRAFFNLNNIADNIIKLAKMDFVEQGKTVMSLPNVDEDDVFQFGIFKVPYQLHARRGSVGKLTSFRRSAQVITRKPTKDSLEADIPLSLDQLVVRYGHYNLKAIGLDITGEIEGTMDTVSFLMTIYGVEDEQGCTASLQDVKVTEVGNIDAKITGLHFFFNAILSALFKFFLRERYIGVVGTIEKVLLKELPVILKEYECDQLYSLFVLVPN